MQQRFFGSFLFLVGLSYGMEGRETDGEQVA
jgi:hypothetical protein